MAKTTIHLTIVGLNRLTASLALALRQYSQGPNSAFDFQITGQDGDKKALEAARHFEVVHEIQSNAQSAIRYADIVITCLPAGVMEGVYEFIGPALKAGTVVLDMSFGKRSALALAQQYFPRHPDGTFKAYLVGIQPLVATPYLFDTRLGVEAADAKLFYQSEMVVAATADVPQEAIKLASDLAAILKMQVHFMEAAEYEAMAKITENLPALLSLALFSSLQDSSGKRDLQRLINPSFALMLHSLRNTEPEDLLRSWTDDPQATKTHLNGLIALLEALRDRLDDDPKEVKSYLKESLGGFDRWLKRRESGKWATELEVEQPPSLLASLLGFGRWGRKEENK
jgi:prephenate dehydrogenase